MEKLTPGEMVAPKAIADFEVALAFKLWNERLIADAAQQNAGLAPDDEGPIIDGNSCGGLGPMWPLLDERPSEYGERVAIALFSLIKKI